MFRTLARSVLMALPAAALSVCALAQSTTAPTTAHASLYQHMLEKMDTNGDGRISLDEYVAAAAARFKSIDTQNKGSIDAADIAASPETLKRDQMIANAIVKHLDTAGKGYVTQDDVVAKAQARFAKLDKNGDGKLTPDELTAPRMHGKFAQAAAGSANAGAGAGASSTFAQKRAAFAQKYFDKLDTNHDGVVTQDEYVAAATARFNKIDAGGSGEVTAQQIAASPRLTKRDQRMAAHEVARMNPGGNGTVTQDQYVAAAKARFAKLDKNGDGFLDADEMPTHRWAHARTAQPNG